MAKLIVLIVALAVSMGAQYIAPVASSSPSVTYGTTAGTAAQGNDGRFANLGTSANTFYAETFSGADFSVKVNACISAVISAGGGTCDARALGGSTAQTASQQINVGNGSVGVSLILPVVGAWRWNSTLGYGCGIKLFNKSYVHSDGVGGAAVSMLLDTVGSSVSMEALLCTDSSASGGMYTHADGFGMQNTAGAYFTNGMAHINNVVDESSFERIFSWNNSGDAWHMENICCGASFKNIQGYASNGFPNNVQTGTYTGSYSQGGIPLLVSGTGVFNAVSINDSTFNAPKTGQPNIKITGAVSGLTFNNVYGEGNGATDTSTAMVYLDSTVQGVSFLGGALSNFCANTGCASKYMIENHSTASLTVAGLSGYAGGYVNDVANSITLAAGSTNTINPPYLIGGNYVAANLRTPSAINLSNSTANSLPAAAVANASLPPGKLTASSTTVAGVACALGSTCTLQSPQTTYYTTGSGTYTTPTGALYLDIEMGGGGGGGTCSGSTSCFPGSGGNSTFGTLTAAGGGTTCCGGTNGGAGGALPTTGDFNLAGNSGGQGSYSNYSTGGIGGIGPFGGSGSGGPNGNPGTAATSVSAGGGGGGSTTTSPSGAGGGSGAFLRKRVTSPSATYSYAVGAGGAGASGGTAAGAAGASGYISVTARFQ